MKKCVFEFSNQFRHKLGRRITEYGQKLVGLVFLRLNFPVNNFSVMSGQSHRFLGIIRKTCPCDLYPLTPHIYIVKLGFTGVYIIF